VVIISGFSHSYLRPIKPPGRSGIATFESNVKIRHPIASNVALFAAAGFLLVAALGAIGAIYSAIGALALGIAFLCLCWAMATGRAKITWPFTL